MKWFVHPTPYRLAGLLRNSLIVTGILFLLLSAGCAKKEDFSLPGPASIKEKGINSWILNNMRYYYYWNTRIPQTVDTTPPPSLFFDNLLVPEDRFSVMIEKIEAPRSRELSFDVGITADDPGFEYRYIYINNINRIVGQVLYVKEGTPARNAGLRRGDLYWKVDDSPLTYLNYSSLIENRGNTFRLTLLNREQLAQGVQADEKQVTISKVAYLEDNPIAFDTLFRFPTGNAGYLVYHFFAPGNSTGSTQFDSRMNQIFRSFREARTTSIILDLRYNRGGYESSARLLSSLMVPHLTDQLLFSKKQYNSTYSADIARYYRADGQGYFPEYFLTRANGAVLENLNQPDLTLYVLTSSATASAGELLINSLKVYMNVVIIGETTVGKNMGSISLTQEDNPDNPWEMHPLVVKVYNARGESNYSGGFIPDATVSESVLLYRYGDSRDPLLSEALQRISGTERATSLRTIPFQPLSSSITRKEPLLRVQKPAISGRDDF